jgi:hypothetical protein
MGLRAVRRRCEAVLESIPVPDPLDVDELASVVSDLRRRPLTLLPKPSTAGPCGVWLATPSADYVFYERQTSALHREHIVLHELGHLLRRHEPTEVMDDDLVSRLCPDLDAGVVRKVLGRTAYTAVEEQEAEMIASLISTRGRQRPDTAAGSSAHGSPLVKRLQATLGAQRPAVTGAR